MEKIWMVHPDGRRKPVIDADVVKRLKADGWVVESESEPEHTERRNRGRPPKNED